MASIKLLLIFSYLNVVFSDFSNLINEEVVTVSTYVYWPNATVPFYVDPDHFDHEQALEIMSALSNFAFKTCIKFFPVMARPEGNEHIMVFENPAGIRKCYINTDPHSIDEPHRVVLGYDCLKSPNIDMIIMKALGFQFEHNRAVRDIYVAVQPENIEPGYVELYTKDMKLPLELRSLPYDPNSVMHFGDRDFSKNGHRTLIFKKPDTKQERTTLSPLDLRKIEIVYGPECLKRDRAEKVELCQNYPGVARRKREITPPPSGSLRVNPDIIPVLDNPDDKPDQGYADAAVKELGIEKEVEDLVEKVHKIAVAALQNAREKHCNGSKPSLRAPVTLEMEKPKNKNILGIVDETASYAKSVVESALRNITEFCSVEKSIDDYQRQACPFFNKIKCQKSYRSTKSGDVKFSTQHRPVYVQSTKHKGFEAKNNIYDSWYRSGNNTEEPSTVNVKTITDPVTPKVSAKRRKRDANTTPVTVLAASETSKVEAKEVETTTVQDVSASKSDLRMGTKILRNRPRYAPNYRSSNDTEAPVDKTTTSGKKKRETLENETQTVNENGRRDSLSQRYRISGNNDKWQKDDQDYNDSGPSKERNSKKKKPNKRGKNRNKAREVNVKKNREMGENRDLDNYDWPFKPKKVHKIRETDNNNKKDVDYNKSDDEKFNKPGDFYSDEDDGGHKKLINKKKDRHRNGNENDHKRVINKKVDKRKPHKGERGDSVNLSEETENASVFEGEEIKPTKIREKGPVKERNEQKRDDSYEKIEVPKKKHKRGKPGPVPRTVALSKKNKEFYDERKWEDNVVIYLIKEDGTFDIEDVRRRLDEVNDILKKKTCVRLQEVSEEESTKYEDFLVLDTSPDYITGKVGGRQDFGVVELLRGGQHRQHTAMMVMAMLGFYFEVSRHDRDQHIRVHMRHVRPDKLHHFEKIREDATLDLPYDYNSATHPAWQFWRQIGRTGISTVATFKQNDPDGKIMKELGQHEELLSELDLVKINSVYGTECFSGSKEDEDSE